VLAHEGQEDAGQRGGTSWLITSAMLIPFDRMRVGINSESASHTQTPGPVHRTR